METDRITDNHDDLNLNETEDNEATETRTINPTSTGRPSLTLKKQPEVLCNCPLHCDTKIGKEWRKTVYKQFQSIEDHALQNQYIQRHIKVKSIAKRLWEEEIAEKKIHRRVTCRYLLPMTGSVMDSYSYSKTLTFDSVKFALDTSCTRENGIKPDPLKDLLNTTNQEGHFSEKEKEPVGLICKTTNPVLNTLKANADNSKITNSFSAISSNCLNNSKMNSSIDTSEPQTEPDILMNKTLPNGTSENMNGHDPLLENKLLENTVKDTTDVNSPQSFNDTDSVNTSPDDANSSELENNSINPVKYIEVCQKAFMNMYGITEKRIRWQREKLILRSRILAEKKRKEFEEMDRTLSLARSLGAGCQPLFALLEKSNCSHLSEQLMGAIEDDVALVNNFFHNQLWKPEDIMNKSIHIPSFDMDSVEPECD